MGRDPINELLDVLCEVEGRQEDIYTCLHSNVRTPLSRDLARLWPRLSTRRITQNKPYLQGAFLL